MTLNKLDFFVKSICQFNENLLPFTFKTCVFVCFLVINFEKREINEFAPISVDDEVCLNGVILQLNVYFVQKSLLNDKEFFMVLE